MITGAGEDISASKTGSMGSNAWALSLVEWFWMTVIWAISMFRVMKMPFLSSSFWTWLQLGASTVSHFIQVLLLKTISKFSILYGQHVPGPGANRSALLFLRLPQFTFFSFFVLSTSVFQFFYFRRVSERKLYSPFEPQTRHSLSLLRQFKDNLLACEEFIEKSTPELQLSNSVCSSSLWNTNALVWA